MAACTLLVNVLIARQLSPTDTGLFILALSLITSAAVLADLGLGKTVLRTIPALLAQGDGAGLKVHLRHVFMLGALTALAGYLLLTGWPGQWLVGLVAGGTGLLALLPLIGLWLVVTLLLNLLAEIWRGFHRVDVDHPLRHPQAPPSRRLPHTRPTKGRVGDPALTRSRGPRGPPGLPSAARRPLRAGCRLPPA